MPELAAPPCLLPSREVLETWPLLVAVLNERGCVDWCNSRWEKQLGFNSLKLEGRSFVSLVFSLDVARVASHISKVGPDTPAILRFRVLSIGAGLRHLEVSLSRLGGKLLLVAHDLTESLRLEQKSAARLELLYQVEAMTGIGTVTLDLASRDISWSPCTFQIHALEPGSFAPDLETTLGFVHPDDRPLLELMLLEATETGTNFDTELRIFRADGEERIVELKAWVESGLDGPCAVTWIVRDLTVQREHERSLSEAREQAIEASHIKSRFLANMSHEIRTPMTGVLGMAELLGTTGLDEEQKEFVEFIDSSAQALLKIIDEILDLSKIEAGKMELEHQSFSCEQIVQDVLLNLSSRAEAKGIALLLRVSPHHPTTQLGDSGRFRQVVMNLLGNAIKFTDEGQVELLLDFEDGCSILNVKDSGIGIAKDKQEKLFAPFVQAEESTTRRYGGTGLGLSISRQLVHRLGGDIELTSEEGVGSEFRASFQFAPDPQATSLSLPPLGGEAVVFHENPRVRENIIALFGARGLSCKKAETRDHALLLLERMNTADPRYLVCSPNSREPDLEQALLKKRVQAIYFAPRFTPSLDLGLANELLLRLPAFRCEVDGALGLHSPTASPSQAAAVSRVSLTAGSDLHVLLVDDDAVSREVVRAMLTDLGHQVTCAKSGAEAIDRWSYDDFSVVLMDVHMPEMDGLETTRSIRQREQDCEVEATRIIALSADAMKGMAEECIDAGMNAFLSKPLDRNRLDEVLRELNPPAKPD